MTHDATPPAANASAKPPSMYAGFTPKMRLWIVLSAGLVACLNLIAAWWLAVGAVDQLPLSDKDIGYIVQLAGTKSTMALSPDMQAQLQKTMIELVGLLKLITNKQGIVLVCFGAGFALIAIGFALFLLGVDGAFTLSAERAEAKVLFSASAPGLFCFAIAGILIGIGVTRESKMHFGGQTSSEVRASCKGLVMSDGSCKPD